MAQTSSAAIQAAVTFKVQAKTLQNLRARLVFANPSWAEQGTFSPGTDALMFVSFPDLAVMTTPGTEGTAPTAKALTMNAVTIDTTQYFDTVEITDMAKVKSPKDLVDVASELLARQAAESIDQISRDEISLGGTPVFQAGDTTRAGLAATDYATGADLMNLFARMGAAKVPKNADGSYTLLAHPYVINDLKQEAVTGVGAWIDVNRYSRPEQIMSGEIGKIHGFRVIEVNNCPTFSSTTTVYGSFAFGPVKGWGAGDLQTLKTYHVAPGGDHDDPVAQREILGWKCNFGVGVLNNSYYYRLETASSLGSA